MRLVPVCKVANQVIGTSGGFTSWSVAAVDGIGKGERRMAHLLSILLFLSLLAGLAMFLRRLFGRHGAAIRAALVGTWVAADRFAETAFSRIGTCLRASFPAVEQEPLGDDLSRLMLQLSEPDPQGSSVEGTARDSGGPSSPNTSGRAAEQG